MKEKFENALGKMWDKLDGWFNAFVVSLPNIILAILVFAIAALISKYIKKIAYRLASRTNLQESMKQLISQIVAILVIIVGLFFVLGILNLGKALNTILAGAGVAGLAVGLALQGALANTYSGIILSYVKQIKFGDWIETNSYEGEVVDIDLRVVTIKQVDNNMVYIPNKLVVENPIKNFSTTAQSRVILECGVGYDSDLEKVRNLVTSTIAKNFEAVENKTDVLFLYREFGDSSINFETRFWINSTSALEVAKAKTEAMIKIKSVFDENNIDIPFPIRTLNIPKPIDIANK
ncbi:Mechanosensitive ion channel protein 1, mitochondrial [Flagellimonas maritima]|uniref:Mechanosensitive ion channel protein 1, mitochondrial n=1 Tax=Flagellimonas maritima TaxID=1383885 RepID=A0A2Z4LN87_9FLAO|nr:mechanosensitive ion channel family protein [Allomuricauda aurantiaca]AWX43199.1 Mechanosensitive ion channel protein 1, mitochondrial [Allomuricauda aurantiaca]